MVWNGLYKVLSVASLLSITSCAYSSRKPINADYINAEPQPELRSDVIIADLKRSQKDSKLEVGVYPFTKTLLQTQRQSKKAIENLVEKENCLMFELSSASKKRAHFRDWVAQVRDADGRTLDVTFANVRGAKSVPLLMKSDRKYRWSRTSMGCTESFDIARGFKVYLSERSTTDKPEFVFEWLPAVTNDNHPQL